MCFHLSNTKKKAEELEDRFESYFERPHAYEPYFHFNGWETKNLYIITQEDPDTIVYSSWGLLPTLFDPHNRIDFLKKTNTLNATRERLFESNLYSQFINHQKCLIIADGLYEPHKVAGVKGSFPYYFKKEDHSLFAFAGVYSVIDDHPQCPMYSASIITTEANDLFKDIHNSPNKLGSYRMPLILDPSDEYDWLWATKDDDIKVLLHTFTKENIEAHSVSKDVFSNKIDSNREDITNQVYYPELNTLF